MHILTKDWLMVLIVALAVLIADLTGLVPIHWMDGRLYDISQGLKQKHADGAERISLIDLGSGSPAEMRLTATQILERLASARTDGIALMLPLHDEQQNPAIPFLDTLRDYVRTADLPRRPAARIEGMINEARQHLDVDEELRLAIGKAGDVVLPRYPAETVPAPRTLATHLDTLLGSRHRLVPDHGTSPLPDFAKAAAGVAPLALWRDGDGTVRSLPLWWQGEGDKAEPTLPLLLASRVLRRAPEAIASPRRQTVYPSYYRQKNDRPMFARFDAADVLAGKVPVTAFRRDIVLIGPGTGAQYPSPLGNRLDAAGHVAQAVASILNQDMYRRPPSLIWTELAVFGLLALLLAFVLPRLGMTLFSITALLLVIGLLGVEQYLLLSEQVWLQIGDPLTLLVVGIPLVGMLRLYRSQHMKTLADSAQSNRQLGLALQEQGKLEMALERFRKLPVSNDNLELLYNLALDFERKRKFNTAETVYQHIVQQRPRFRDAATRLTQARSMAKSAVLGTDRFMTSSGGMLVVEGAGEKPMLGRYVVAKELGKGAMGAVYLGHDPKIGRTVAIKTMALAQEFTGDEVAEAEKRFFHEASAAGRLNHPNIVTIYDAAEEHDLAYIAMEYIEGTPLTQYTRKGKLLPVATVLEIGMQAADALDYAHAQGIVHRDIKPANLMYNEHAGIKITDFGIARITSSGHTKTGTILGTPSFMSPEQMIGKPVDGRSDIFSLGVTLFVLLCGQKPFNGDSLAAISYQVVNDKQPDILALRPELPPCIKRFVDKAMQKNPDNRYQNGKAMKTAIQRCLKEIGATPA
ncbi:MAG TPA: serine/threonine-protein kinase [Mariprofundaceae bacterium]|nr:serine/threonine-protein kinase [Mariprofundaceae bacterium]